jgi:hypothetical protein
MNGADLLCPTSVLSLLCTLCQEHPHLLFCLPKLHPLFIYLFIHAFIITVLGFELRAYTLSHSSNPFL